VFLAAAAASMRRTHSPGSAPPRRLTPAPR
jgi:hypothetical protein